MMKNPYLRLLSAAAAFTLAGCTQAGDGNAAANLSEEAANEIVVNEAAANGMAAPPEGANSAASEPEAPQAAQPRTSRPAPRAERPRPKAEQPAADPHAGHDMGNMANMQH